MPEYTSPAPEKLSGKIQAAFVAIPLDWGNSRRVRLRFTLAPNDFLRRLPRSRVLRGRRTAGLNFLFSYYSLHKLSPFSRRLKRLLDHQNGAANYCITFTFARTFATRGFGKSE
jgi:hypothetical protein